jgi:hypothetical protein
LQERLETKNQLVLKTRIKDLEDSLSHKDSSNEQSLKIIKDQLRSTQHQLEQEQIKWSHDHNNLLSQNKNLEQKINDVISLLPCFNSCASLQEGT